MWHRLLGILIATFASGCAAHGSARTLWLSSYALGSVAGGELDLRDICASGRARSLRVGSSWGTLGISLATLGLYTPREVKVECAPLR
jgi:hypothetical protein